MKKKILIIIIVIISIIQFFRIDKNNPKSDPDKSYFTLDNPSEEIRTMLKTSCYDCHSNETVYPWYSNVAPISWFLKNHINEGREHVNFSEWGNYSSEKQNDIKKDCNEELIENEMPLSSYTLVHSDAKLDENRKTLLADWFNQGVIVNEDEGVEDND